MVYRFINRIPILCYYIFIIASPYEYTWVFVQPDYLGFNLLFDIVYEFQMIRLHTACEHEFLPHHHAYVVHLILECGREVVPPSPHSQHVHIGCGRHVDQVLKVSECDSIAKCVHRDHVGTFSEEWDVVYSELE